MKAVMKSCKPYWMYLITKGIKIIEVGKTKPMAKDWNKTVYMYCSKNKKSLNKIPQEDREWFGQFLGKVVCEFVCDRVEGISKARLGSLGLGEFEDVQRSCLTEQQIYDYCQEKDIFYMWHISDLKIYDEPKEPRELGISRPPQSWQYCEELEEE